MKILIIILILMLQSNLALARKCPIVEQYPHTDSFQLSNGQKINLPCKSDNFDVISIMAWMDYAATEKLIRAQGATGFPLVYGKKALGIFMVYQYHQSDMGPFNEIYFLSPLTTKKSKGTLTSLLQLQKLKRHWDKPPTSDIYFYYFSVFSGTLTAQLGSKEIWGIDSILADIKIENLHKKKSESFSLHVAGKEWLSFHAKKTHYFLPDSGNLNLLITGTNPDGNNIIYSPVISCGRYKYARFNSKNHHWVRHDNPLNKLFSHLKFTPFWLAKGLGMQAVQFAPNTSNLKY